MLAALLFAATARTFDAHIRLTRAVASPPISPLQDASCKLEDYMRLPVEQYCNIPLPMDAKLVRTSTADEFALDVPPIRFAVPGFPLTVSPCVLATVMSEPDRVVIASDSCTLTGSPIIESIRLNERFDFRLRTTLTWDSAVKIHSSTQIEVDVETPQLFALVPRPLLVAIASTAMRIVLDALLEVFLRNLAADYERWATDADYRASRAALSSAPAV